MAPERRGKGPAPRPLALTGARLLDPASGRDAPGGLLVVDGRIADLGPGIYGDGLAPEFERIDCAGHCLAPGLVDIRTQLREPGEEHKETIATASAASPASSSSPGAPARPGVPRSIATAR